MVPVPVAVLKVDPGINILVMQIKVADMQEKLVHS
jgi:hypothetical protein